MENLGLTRRSDGVVGAPDDRGGSGDAGEIEVAVGVQHIGEGAFHILGGAGVIGGAGELVPDLGEAGETLQELELLREGAGEVAFLGLSVNASGVQEDEVAEFLGLSAAEVEQDAAAVAVAEGDGAVGDFLVGPLGVVGDGPDLVRG